MSDFRVLVSGSRNWDHQLSIELAFQRNVDALADDHRIVVVSGNCPTGADKMCEDYARSKGYELELHPADWDTHGKKAGYLRNKEMVDSGVDLGLFFILANSKGATMTLELAREAGMTEDRLKIWRRYE